MKKLLLLGAIGLLSANLSAQTTESTYYTMGEAVSSAEGLQSGLYYISGYSTKGQGLVQANASGDTFANLRTSTKVLAAPDNDKSLLWKIDVNEEDHSFTVQSVLTDEYWSLRGATVKVTTSGRAGVVGIIQRTNGTYTGSNIGTAEDHVITNGMDDTGHYLLEDITNGFDYESVNEAKGTRFMIKLDGGWVATKFGPNGEFGAPYAHIIDNCAVSYWGEAQNPNATTTCGQFAFYPAVEVSAASVTFNFGDGLTATASVEVGSVIDSDSEILNTVAAEFCPWGISSATVANAVTVSATGENVVNVTPTWALPFEANKPYRLRLRPNDDTHAMVYTGTIGTVRDHAALAAELNPVSIWYFTPAAPVDNKLAFTLHTLAVEDAKGMRVNKVDNATGVVIADNPTRFVPVKTNKTNDGANPATDFCLRAEGGANRYVNEYLGPSGKNFAIYDSNSCLNDIGSVLRMVALTDADFEGTGWHEDGVLYDFDAEKKAAAQANPTVENLRALFAEKRQLTYDDAKTAFETYVIQTSAIGSAMIRTGLFNAETVMGAIGVSIAAEGVSDYTAELATKKAAVDDMDIHSLLVSYLNGKKVAFYGNSGERYIGNGNANGQMKRGSTTLTPTDVWEITAHESDNVSFTMKNLADGKFGNGNSLSDEAGVYKLVNGNVLNNGSFAIQSPANNGNYLNDNTGENPIRLFNAAGSGNGSSFFKIRLVTAEHEAAWKQAIADKFAHDYSIGKLAGQFTTENPEKYAADKAYAEQIASVEELDYPTVARLINKTFTLNPVLPGQLIRIKSVGGTRNYAITQNAEGNVSVGFTTETAVFYYTPEGHLVSMANGLAASNNGGNTGMLTGATTAEQNGNIANHAREITFKAAEGSNVFGRYLMTFMNGTTERFVYNTGSSDAINGGSDITTSTNNYANYTFAVEPVMSLTVAVDGADGCGSIIAPVDLTVRAVDGVQVYEAKTTGEDKLKFEPVEVGTTVAAGTPLIIYNETMAATTVDFDVDYSALTAPATVAEEGAATVENRFGGSHLALVHAEPAETHVTYVKSAEAFDNDNHEGTPVRFDRLREGDVVPAGAVTVKLVQDLEDTTKTPEFTLLDLSGENVGTTMIEEITEGVNAAAEGAVYDLQGRRLAAPVKGINIINGKKVLVK